MTLARSLAAASLSLALMGAFTLATRLASVRAEARPPVQATIIVNGKSRTVTSDATRLSDLLAQAGVAIQPGDEVNPDPSTTPVNGMAVKVNTLQTRMDVRRVQIPFETVYKKTIRLLPGHRSEAQPGIPGIEEQHILVTSIGGQELSRALIKTGWFRKPSKRVVLVGTDPFLASRGMDAPRRFLDMRASKYDIWLGGAGSGRTRTGVRARRGIVAVDPRVIRLGTHLYVPGYGYCVAADTGGAIKGRRIDLCVETTREADRYGIHPVRVYILD